MSRQDREWTVQLEAPDGSWNDVYWVESRAHADEYKTSMAFALGRRTRVMSSRELIASETPSAGDERERSNDEMIRERVVDRDANAVEGDVCHLCQQELEDDERCVVTEVDAPGTQWHEEVRTYHPDCFIGDDESADE